MNREHRRAVLLLALLALVTLIVKTALEWRFGHELANGPR